MTAPDLSYRRYLRDRPLNAVLPVLALLYIPLGIYLYLQLGTISTLVIAAFAGIICRLEFVIWRYQGMLLEAERQLDDATRRLKAKEDGRQLSAMPPEAASQVLEAVVRSLDAPPEKLR
jgi:hypothetical protein